jgi:hypothetical protein
MLTLDIGHVKVSVEVSCPRARHWSKGKGSMEKGFGNEIFERRPSLVKLEVLNLPRGKGLGK